jgi:Ca-activated chloride channel homolog
MPLYYLIYLWLLFSSKIEVTKITRANRLITEAEESFKNGQYVLALVKYRYLTNSMQIRDSRVLLNLAHCYFLNNDHYQAQKYYGQLQASSSTSISSVAFQQLGVIAFENKAYKQALDYFRQSLSADPGNESSRYNYELVARLLPAGGKTGEEKKQDNKPEEEQAPPPPEHENQIGQSGAQADNSKGGQDTQTQQQQEIERKLRQINLSEEKAKMILDAMKNSEIQYIQQRRKQASGQEAKNLPDW